MEPRLVTAWLLFASSYAPLGGIIAALDFDWSKKDFAHPMLVCLILLISVTAGLTPFLLLRSLKHGVLYRVGTLTNRSGDLVGYALPYLATFIGLKLSEPGSVVAFMLFMALFGALTIRTQALWINPLLALRGYRLYEATLHRDGDVQATAFVLSRLPLIQNARVKADHLTDDLLYVTGVQLDNRSTEPERNIRAAEED